jgi:predicted porin
MIYYNKYHSGPQSNDTLAVTTAGADLFAIFPNLPVLSLSYSLDKTFSTENGSIMIDDINDTLTLGFSYPIGRARVSANYLRSNYEDVSNTVGETYVSTDYGFSIPWGRRTTLLVNYLTSSSDDNSINTARTRSHSIALGVKYNIIPRKLILFPQYKLTSDYPEEDRKIATSLEVYYYFTSKSLLKLKYSLTSSDLVDFDKAISDKVGVNLSYQHNLKKNQRLELSYVFNNQRNFTTTDSSTTTWSLRFICNYHF